MLNENKKRVIDLESDQLFGIHKCMTTGHLTTVIYGLAETLNEITLGIIISDFIRVSTGYLDINIEDVKKIIEKELSAPTSKITVGSIH